MKLRIGVMNAPIKLIIRLIFGIKIANPKAVDPITKKY